MTIKIVKMTMIFKMTIKIVKMSIKLCKRFFFHKISRDETFYGFVGMTSLRLDAKLSNFRIL